MKNITIDYLQKYIKAKDYNPELIKDYFLKLSEETGELSNAIRKNLLKSEDGTVKNTIDEEIWDVIYYAIAIANCYDIDISKAIQEKEAINKIKYQGNITFGDEL